MSKHYYLYYVNNIIKQLAKSGSSKCVFDDDSFKNIFFEDIHRWLCKSVASSWQIEHSDFQLC